MLGWAHDSVRLAAPRCGAPSVFNCLSRLCVVWLRVSSPRRLHPNCHWNVLASPAALQASAGVSRAEALLNFGTHIRKTLRGGRALTYKEVQTV